MVYYQNISAYKWSHVVDEKLEFEIEKIHLNPSQTNMKCIEDSFSIELMATAYGNSPSVNVFHKSLCCSPMKLSIANNIQSTPSYIT